jgi:hypothetical protein
MSCSGLFWEVLFNAGGNPESPCLSRMPADSGTVETGVDCQSEICRFGLREISLGTIYYQFSTGSNCSI